MAKKSVILNSKEVVVLITAPSRPEAKKIAQALVKEKLAACVNLIASVQSIYEWQGKICDDREVLMVCKSRKALFSQLVQRVQALHSYTVPEIIALPIEAGSSDYLQWIREVTRPS